MMIRMFLIAAFIMLTGIYNSAFSQLLHPYNMDFEESNPGFMPTGWTLPEYAAKLHYKASSVSISPYEGRMCLELRNEGRFKEEMYGSVMQSLDATPYRGKKVRFTAAVRTDFQNGKGTAHLWLSERKYKDEIGFINDMKESPITLGEWKIYEVTGEISEDARLVNYGLMLKGTGVAWIDKSSFEIISPSASAAEPPRQLSKQELTNIAAFAKLYGYIRYFYAGIESQMVNWEKFAVYGIKEIEKAKDNDELSDKLKELFKPIAPGLEIYLSGSKVKMADRVQMPENAMKGVALAWKHIGIQTESENTIFRSEPVNVLMPQRENEAVVSQIMDASKFRGKHLSFTGSVKANLVGPSGNAQLWLRIDGPGEKVYYQGSMQDKPITANKWSEYSIETDVPDDAAFIRLGLVVIGEGEAWFDDMKLIASGSKGKETFEPKNAGFEEGSEGKVTFGWRFLSASEKAGYSAEITGKGAKSGKHCLRIASDEKTRVSLPSPGELFTAMLPGDIQVAFALALFVDSTHTLPYPDDDYKQLDFDKVVTTDISIDDRISRLALTTILWNMLRHFNMAGTDSQVWDNLLKEALIRASTVNGPSAFTASLKKILPGLKDGQARIWHESEQYRHAFPFLLKWIDNRLIVSAVLDDLTDLKPGDIITEIEGRPASDYFAEKEIDIPGISPDLKRLTAIAEFRVGNQGSSAKLKVKSLSGKEYETTAGRNSFVSDLFEEKLPPISEIRNGIFYVDLTRLGDLEIRKVLDSLKTGRAFVFDTRGVALSSEHLLGLFTNRNLKSLDWKVPVFTKPEEKNISFKLMTNEIKSNPVMEGKKFVFLSDARTIGYAEGLLDIVKMYGLGEIVGMPTAGAAGEIFAFRLPAGIYVSMTSVYGFEPDGKMVFTNPVQPTVKVYPTAEGIAAGKDEILEKAVSLLDK